MKLEVLLTLILATALVLCAIYRSQEDLHYRSNTICDTYFEYDEEDDIFADCYQVPV